jgi:DNA invertase Pin-like site-specific DNA recombinase
MKRSRAKTAEIPAMPRIAVYMRVSSDEQVLGGFSLDTQEELCVARLDELYGRGLYTYELFREEGLTGKLGLCDPQRPKKPFRPELTRLKDALDQGDFQAVCVCGLDRLFRSPSLIPRLIEEVFSTGDVRFISVHESGLELDNPSGRPSRSC